MLKKSKGCPAFHTPHKRFKSNAKNTTQTVFGGVFRGKERRFQATKANKIRSRIGVACAEMTQKGSQCLTSHQRAAM